MGCKSSNLKVCGGILLIALTLFAGAACAQNCSNLPTQFTGNEFPTGDFFSNFQNPCYMIPMTIPPGTFTDLNDTDWHVVYKVDPRYQLILVGNFPNARYFSFTAYDDHSLIGQALLDTDIVPLTSSYVNPYQPNVPYASGQQYAVAVNFGGTPGTQETGCMMNGYNVAVNSLDATQRHQFLNWNTDPGFMQTEPTPPVHNVDTPQHTNPTQAGYLLARAYVDINITDPTTTPSVIVRDVASGCAYPAAYALNTLQIVSTSESAYSVLDQAQFQEHQTYNSYLPSYCYSNDPGSVVNWTRNREGGTGPNPFCAYLNAPTPANLPGTLSAAGEVMRLRLRVPMVPPTPCTNGCSLSGNEQVRYFGLSLNGANNTLSSVADSAFTQDANGYATLIVGTGASIPAWITPANGYTFLDLTAVPDYQSFASFIIREILPSSTFACSAQNVPYKTTVYTPQGSLTGDYMPVVDYPPAATLPQTASELVGQSACGSLPVGLPIANAGCGLVPANPPAIAAVPAPGPGLSPLELEASPPITLSGSGFGFLPEGEPYTGNSNYLQITDWTQNWSAGYTGSPCTVSVGNWADTRIELIPNLNQNGLCSLAPGDQLSISVWNPQSGSGPVTANLAAPSNPGYALAAYSTVVGSASGKGTVELIAAGPWSAASNSLWLQVSPSSSSGTGSALIEYTYDANTNSGLQTGTLTIAGLTFTVTQAGTSYAPVAPLTALVSSGLNAPQGVAVDAQGNVYIADTGNNAIEQWNAGTQQLNTLVPGLSAPTGVAVDASGNVYIADGGSQSIKEWNAATQQVSILVAGLGDPYGVALDAQANVYFSDAANNAIEEWSAVTAEAALLAAGSGSIGPTGLAVDGLGNIDFANTGGNAIEQWNPGAPQAMALVSSGLSGPAGVAVDGQGNVYFSDTGNNQVKQWIAANGQVVTLAPSGLNSPAGVAVDGQGNLYIADQNNNAIEKVVFAYLSLGSKNLTEAAAAGGDSVTAQVLPASTPITATSDQPWLTIAGVTGGTIDFTFQANTTMASRVAHIAVLGQQVTVTQQSGLTAQTITFNTLSSQVFGAAPFTVGATASSGLPVSFVATTPEVCTLSGAMVTLVQAGTCTIQATQPGNAIYAAAPPVSQSFQVTQASQTITFPALSNQPYGTPPFTVGATASSGLAVNFASTTTAVCAVSGATVTLAGKGTCIIQATQAGNIDYAAARTVNKNFQVTKGSQTIVFGALSSQTFGAPPFTIGATASSGLPVSFKSQTPRLCSVSGATVTLAGVGTCTILATQPGNPDYTAAPSVSQSFQIAQGGQTITFAPLANQTLGTSPFTISATASSGLAVTFTSKTTRICSVAGGTVTLMIAGKCTIQAAQKGDADWAAAVPVQQSFQVTE